jgi:hypothetical protein
VAADGEKPMAIDTNLPAASDEHRGRPISAASSTVWRECPISDRDMRSQRTRTNAPSPHASEEHLGDSRARGNVGVTRRERIRGAGRADDVPVLPEPCERPAASVPTLCECTLGADRRARIPRLRGEASISDRGRSRPPVRRFRPLWRRAPGSPAERVRGGPDLEPDAREHRAWMTSRTDPRRKRARMTEELALVLALGDDLSGSGAWIVGGVAVCAAYLKVRLARVLAGIARCEPGRGCARTGRVSARHV